MSELSFSKNNVICSPPAPVAMVTVSYIPCCVTAVCILSCESSVAAPAQ